MNQSGELNHTNLMSIQCENRDTPREQHEERRSIQCT